ncbi:MAG TPA: hypothetical protein VGL72_26935 [Bryobacteraceae bacterium]|jgi:hypothetical protein
MKRLLIWNLALAVCATAGIYQLRRQWIETRTQENAVLLRKPVAPKAQVVAPPVKPAPFQATSYNDVAQKMLFSKDRNPTIEVIAPPPPPPPPPMPPLPKVYGVMGLPSGAVAIMSEASGGAQKKIRQNDSIGEFKVAKLSNERITLQWRDKTVDKSIDELLDRAAPAPAPAAAAAATPTPGAPPAPPPAATGPPQFGVEIGPAGHSVRACKADDSSPAGTVLEGYKKTIENTPFGQACRWQQQ